MVRLFGLIIGMIGLFTLAVLAVRLAAPRGDWPFPLNTINTSPGCQLPCWHGITPHVTTLQQAEMILDNDPAFGRLSTFADDDQTGMRWRLSATPDQDNTILIAFDDHKIVSTVTLLGGGSPGQVIAALGTLTEAEIDQQCSWRSLLLFPAAAVSLENESLEANDSRPWLNSAQRVIIELGIPPIDPQSRSGSTWEGFKSPPSNPDPVDCTGD